MNAGLKAGSGFKVHIVLSLALLVAAIVLGGTYPGSGAPRAAAAPARHGIPVCKEEASRLPQESRSDLAVQNGEMNKAGGQKSDSKAVDVDRNPTAEACSGD
jgi:hypothetical protein